MTRMIILITMGLITLFALGKGLAALDKKYRTLDKDATPKKDKKKYI